MSFMEQPQPDACRALMPTPENPPPGPPSRPIVCYMPKGHDETDGHAETRRPGPLARRWHGDARPQVTVVDRPDNGQDEGDAPEFAWLPSEPEPREPGALLRLALGAGEQQRERVARWLQEKVVSRDRSVAQLMGWQEQPQAFRDGWLSWADELLALLGGPQPDGEAVEAAHLATCSDRHTDGDLTMYCEQIPGHVGPHVNHRIYW